MTIKQKKFYIPIGKKKIVFHFNFLMKMFANFKKISFRRYIFGFIIIFFCTFFLHFFLHWSLEASFFIPFLLTSYIARWSSALSLSGAIIGLTSLLIITPFYNSGYIDELFISKIALWTYYFLVISIIGYVIEIAINNKKQRSIRTKNKTDVRKVKRKNKYTTNKVVRRRVVPVADIRKRNKKI